jgi:hypothetical protein
MWGAVMVGIRKMRERILSYIFIELFKYLQEECIIVCLLVLTNTTESTMFDRWGYQRSKPLITRRDRVGV